MVRKQIGDQKRTTCLTIAGSDPSGGAGIQADLRVFQSLSVCGLSAITAITAQTESRFLSLHPIPADVLTQQLSSLAEDHVIDAVKIGVIATASNVQAVCWFIKRLGDIPIVIDPVFDSSTGFPLLESGALPALEQHLLPLATVVTPNLPEASTLAKMQVSNLETIHTAAKTIHENIRKMRGGGTRKLAVIIKGGHLDEMSTDMLYDGERYTRIDGEHLDAGMHGTGCIYSSAIAVYLAKGLDVREAAEKAKEFVTEYLKND